ncbi:hypothetical protein LG047_04000 [Methylocystis sp. WRRC1]|uniref:hypothetical protein n=1 Tax=Methylocystis sp. WRRC1 TaxID=1732014 RepID=UPI001D159F04|nr:hypothetical protein [Methylocystis sp. WRRC1]MCC3244491.1 hypothetical protein [Methylocystis sp. WRRC1]
MTSQDEARDRRAGPDRSSDSAGARGEEGFSDNYRQLWDRFQESNKQWLDRYQSEASLALEFTGKLTAARSVSDAADAYQHWTVKHIEMATEDARRAMADVQHFWEAGTRLWSDAGGEAGRIRGMMS